MDIFALLFSLSAIGISEVVYLIKKRLAGQHAYCVIGGGCSTVLESKYSTIYGVHNDVLGLLFYVGMTVVTAAYILEFQPIVWVDAAASIMVASGALMSLALTYIQAKLIKSWCFWCLMSAFTIWTMAAIILVRNGITYFV